MSSHQTNIWDWYQNVSEEELLAAYVESPETTQQKLQALLGAEEAQELVLDLEHELLAKKSQTHNAATIEAIDDDSAEIFFLHGILGAHLAVNKFRTFKDCIWLDPKELAKGNIPERLGLNLDESNKSLHTITPHSHIKLVYGKATRRWRWAGFKVHQFSYDWRVSIERSADRLHEAIEQRWKKNGNKKMTIVAHSMGGLVASLYSHKYPEWQERIKHCVFMGCPLGGSYAVPVAVLGHHTVLNNMAKLSTNDNPIEFRQMAASFPGLLDMLPNSAIFPDAADFYTQKGWPGKVQPAQIWLDQSKRLKGIFQSAPILKNTKIFMSLSHGTRAEMPWFTDRTDRILGDLNHKGDGTVAGLSAFVEGVEAFELQKPHPILPRDNAGIEAVICLIRGDNIELNRLQQADVVGLISSETIDQTTNQKDKQVDGSGNDEAELAAKRQRFKTGKQTHQDIEPLLGL